MKKTWRRTRAFFAAFALTACLLSTGAGLLLADINTRRMTDGDSSYSLPYVAAAEPLDQMRPGTEEAEDSAVQRLARLLPAPIRAGAALLEAGRRLAGRCLELLLPF